MFWKFLGCALLVFVLVIVVYAGWSLATAKIETLVRLEHRLFKPTVGFVLGVETDRITTTLRQFEQKIPLDPRVSDRTPQTINDFDTVLFLLPGFESAPESVMMRILGIDTQSIAVMEPGDVRLTTYVGFGARLHPLPFYVNRRRYIFADVIHLDTTYRPECLPNVLYDLALLEFVETDYEACERTI